MTTTLKKISGSATSRRSGSSSQASGGSAGAGDFGISAVPRTITVSVVGLSGTEKEKGCTGVGKSCLCNRFVRPGEDDYYTDHISVLSQTDFGGRVVNNDHFLYWGEVTKGQEVGDEAGQFATIFQVVEQTEFIDDSSFQPFKSGKTDPYFRRCAGLRLTSAEKLMYICKSQLGIEKEFEQKVLPDGRLSVEGFVCVFDVSNVPGRPLDRALEITGAILKECLKTKKPVVVAATKCDEADENVSKELERLLNRKEFRSAAIPLIETSAHAGVNVDAVFFVLAQLIDKTRSGKLKILSYPEALRHRREWCEMAKDSFFTLIRNQVTDYRTLWQSASKKLANAPDFRRYVEVYGRDAAKRSFMQHTRRLKEEYIKHRLKVYLRALPDVLLDLLPDLELIKKADWKEVKDQLREHPDFDLYFVDRPDEPWQELVIEDDETLLDGDLKIPFQLLDCPEAETCYVEHRASLESEDRHNILRKHFKQLLEETGYVTPGKTFSEVRVLFMGRDCYEDLPEPDLIEIYEDHQREITERAKQQFQELLLERAELFYDFANVGPGSVITQDDIGRITDSLQEDIRYKLLERLDQERMLILLRHLGFVHGPMREHCPANPRCMDQLVEKTISQRAGRPQSWSRNSQWLLDGAGNAEHPLNLVMLGEENLPQDLVASLNLFCPNNVFELEKGQRYSLDFRVISGDVTLPENSFRTQDFLPHGCFCVYSDLSSLDYIRNALENALLSNLEHGDRLPFHGLPIVVLFAPDLESVNEEDLSMLRNEGENRAKSLQCPFFEVRRNVSTPARDASGREFCSLDEQMLVQAMSSLIESIHRRAELLQIYHSLPEHAVNPDVRLLLCMLCGDPYAVEHVLAPMLSQQCCLVTRPPNVLTLETYLGSGSEGRSIIVEVQITSYHEAHHYRDQLLHGYVLVYSAERRASLATLVAFSKNLQEIPIQMVAVISNNAANGGAGNSDSAGEVNSKRNGTMSSQHDHPEDDEEEQQRIMLLREGAYLAQALNAHFVSSSPYQPLKISSLNRFLADVVDQKPHVERSYSLEDDDDEIEDEGLEESGGDSDPTNYSEEGNNAATLPLSYLGGRGGPHHHPPPVPIRHESRHMGGGGHHRSQHHHQHHHQASTASSPEDGGDSEGLYEQLPGESGIPSPPLYNADDKAYPLYSNTVDSSEHLVKPSDIKNRRSLQATASDDAPPPLPRNHPTLSQRGGGAAGAFSLMAREGGGPPSLPLFAPFVPSPSSISSSPHVPSSSTAAASSRHIGSLFRNGGGAVRNFLLKKSSSLRTSTTAPATPPLGGGVRHPQGSGGGVSSRRSLDAGRTPTSVVGTIHSDEEAADEADCDDDDTVSSGLSASCDFLHAYGAYPPPPDPAPPDLLPPTAAHRLKKGTTSGLAASGWVDNRYDRGATTFGHSRTAADSNGEGDPLFAASNKPAPGKLNLKRYDHLTDAISRMNMGGSGGGAAPPPFGHHRNDGAASPTHRDMGGKHRVKSLSRAKHKGDYDKVAGGTDSDSEYGDNEDDDEEPPWTSSLERRAIGGATGPPPMGGGGTGGRKPRKRRGIPVATPRIPAGLLSLEPSAITLGGGDDTSGGGLPPFVSGLVVGEGSSVFSSMSSPLDPNDKVKLNIPEGGFSCLSAGSLDDANSYDISLITGKSSLGGGGKSRGVELTAAEKAHARKERKREEKRERQRIKDERRKRTNEKAGPRVEDFAQRSGRPVPLFVEKCIAFIEDEGMDSEGIYRVPGNRAHVDLLFQKFDEDSNVCIRDLDIPVNAVATALKDFFSKRLPPLFSPEEMEQMSQLASENHRDRTQLAQKLRQLVGQMPTSHFEILKFVFHHFVKVSERCRANSMDSKNLAICWWPTLLPLEFSDMLMFERVRPHLEDSVQTLIDQFRFIFNGEDEMVMV